MSKRQIKPSSQKQHGGDAKKAREGAYFEIDLGNETFAYGRVLQSPTLGFYDTKGPKISSVELQELDAADFKYKIWVMKDAFKRPNWNIIGFKDLEPSVSKQTWFFKKDAITGELSIYSSWNGKTEERSASVKECKSLECAAVWSAVHVEQRLRDDLNNVPNKTLRYFQSLLE